MAEPTVGNRNYENVDWDNLIEEIEDLCKRERQAIRSNLVVVLLHLLKWQFQPEYRTGCWAGIQNQDTAMPCPYGNKYLPNPTKPI